MSHDVSVGLVQALNPLQFPLWGSRLIEASAGTGKTYTIAALYLRLVLRHGGENAYQRPLVPPDILVVTFTDAATQELRDRIRQRLSEAAELFARAAGDAQGLQKVDPLLVALRAEYEPERWPACARLLREAANWMDEAAVSTIH
ncbi:MAG: UvrD-helicase domain-containing protein, partial [Comamonas sp.]